MLSCQQPLPDPASLDAVWRRASINYPVRQSHAGVCLLFACCSCAAAAAPHVQASDVAVLQREDQQLGMPCFVAVVKGLDFGRQFAAQFGGLLTGAL
jgi:hypothetical protein